MLLLILLECVRRVVIATQIQFQFRRQTSKVSKRIRDNLCVQEIDRGRIGFDDKPYKDSAKRSLKKKMKKWSQANQRSEKYWSGWHIKETRKSKETGPEKEVDI